MSTGEFEPVAYEDYGPLLMDAFKGVNYEPAEIPELYLHGPVYISDVKKRLASDFDTEQGAWWMLHDTLNRIEAPGRVAVGRVVILEKQDGLGTIRLRLWTPQEHGVSIDGVDHELPPDFSPRQELMKGLKFLAKSDEA